MSALSHSINRVLIGMIRYPNLNLFGIKFKFKILIENNNLGSRKEKFHNEKPQLQFKFEYKT